MTDRPPVTSETITDDDHVIAGEIANRLGVPGAPLHRVESVAQLIAAVRAAGYTEGRREALRWATEQTRRHLDVLHRTVIEALSALKARS